MKTFEIEVVCVSGTNHTHTIVVESGDSVFGSSEPNRARLQYTCPVTGAELIATFKPPVGAARPFNILKVT